MADLWLHYHQRHQVTLTTSYTIREALPDLFPELCADIDMHQQWGQWLSRQNALRASPDITVYSTKMNEHPQLACEDAPDIMEKWEEAFTAFFHAIPISLHGHAGDALSSQLLISIVLFLKDRIGPLSSKTALDLPKTSLKSCHSAVLKGVYGGAFGSLAHVARVRDWRAWACGTPPAVIDSNSASISGAIKRAKRRHCAFLLVEMVSSETGVALSPYVWRELLRACQSSRLLIVVDETITAIRCGAPFAYQRPEYVQFGRPDMIVFGKAVRTHGVALDLQGINIGPLVKDIESPQDLCFRVFSQPASAMDLLLSWGTLHLAKAQDWPGRAQTVSKVLRSIITVDYGISEPKGLEALVWMEKESLLGNPDRSFVRSMDISPAVISATAGEAVTRWLPLLDAPMLSIATVKKNLFGFDSRPYRILLSKRFEKICSTIPYCIRCGSAIDADKRPACDLCVGRTCASCEVRIGEIIQQRQAGIQSPASQEHNCPFIQGGASSQDQMGSSKVEISNMGWLMNVIPNIQGRNMLTRGV